MCFADQEEDPMTGEQPEIEYQPGTKTRTKDNGLPDATLPQSITIWFVDHLKSQFSYCPLAIILENVYPGYEAIKNHY